MDHTAYHHRGLCVFCNVLFFSGISLSGECYHMCSSLFGSLFFKLLFVQVHSWTPGEAQCAQLEDAEKCQYSVWVYMQRKPESAWQSPSNGQQEGIEHKGRT